MAQEKKLVRNTSNKMIAGVCSGLADYLGLDASLVRIGFVVVTLFTGFPLLIYLVMWIALPEGDGMANMGGGGVG